MLRIPNEAVAATSAITLQARRRRKVLWQQDGSITVNELLGVPPLLIDAWNNR